MALELNGTSIPATGNLNLNGTSLTVLNLNATEVWRKVTDVNVLKAGAYTVSGKNGGSYANTSQMSANSNGGKTDVYNHAICIKVSTGDHTKLTPSCTTTCTAEKVKAPAMNIWNITPAGMGTAG